MTYVPWFGPLASCALLVSLALPGAADTPRHGAATPWTVTRPAASFDRAHLPDPRSAERIRAAANLGGAPGECCITGWAEFDFQIPRTGWYELAVAGSGREVEYIINADRPAPTATIYDSSGNVVAGLDKIGSVWLPAGANSVRLQRYYWTGFPRLTQVVLRAAPPTPAGSVRAGLESPTAVFRAGQCAPLIVYHGALASPTTLHVETRDSDGRLASVQAIALTAAASLQKLHVQLPCDTEGDFLVAFRDQKQGWLAWRDVRGISYQVIARTPAPAPSARRDLVADIDAVARTPDYQGGGVSRLVTQGVLRYRETGDVGFTRYQRAPDAVRRAMPAPSWLAYALDDLEPQKLYEVEIEYPDNFERSMVMALREPSPLSYPVSTGVDTGGEFARSERTQRHSILFWPRSRQARLVLMNVHDGRHAALSRIRVYRRDDLPAPAQPLPPGRRQVMLWYEEGANFHSVVGTPDASRHEWRAQPRRLAADRWVRLARHGGATLISPTVGVYSFSLYPSAFNRSFSSPEGEDFRHLLLAAEKHGMKVIPELHPRADELDWPHAAGGHPRPNVLLSREGHSNYFQRDGRTRNVPPHFNPIDPVNQDWYVGYITELAARHKDSPALAGISLRLMPWANASLNNFVSLEWGYDDLSVARFALDTGISLPSALRRSAATQPEIAAARHAWLTRHARVDWINWRCRAIAALHLRIRDALHAVRPDLKLYTTVFAWQEDRDDARALKEAGIDIDLLRNLSGVEVIDARATYGRREPDEASNQRRRQRLLAPTPMGEQVAPPSHHLATASYVEATDIIVPPDAIGFSANTKRTWVSAAMTPSGVHILERYALQLARTDALMLGDGGNGYAIGQPLLHAWLREYRALPARAFAPLAQTTGSITVRTFDDESQMLAYVVNRSAQPLDLALTFSTGAGVRRLADGQLLAAPAGRLNRVLEPYELVTFSAPPQTRVLSAQARPRLDSRR